MTTSQRVSSRGVGSEPQRDPDWAGLVTYNESTSKSVHSAWIMKLSVVFLFWISSVQSSSEVMQELFTKHCSFLFVKQDSFVTWFHKDVPICAHFLIIKLTVFKVNTYWFHLLLYFLFFKWCGCSIRTLVKGSGVWLAAGAGSWSLCEHGSCLDLLWADTASGFTTGPWEGEMKQNF